MKRWIIVLLPFVISAVGFAQEKTEGKKMADQLKTACKADVDKLCGDVTPGEGRIAQCLESKNDQLSPTCDKAWTDAKAKVSQKMDKAEVEFRKSCGSDVQKFCADIPSGRGRILDCLSEHTDALSKSCTSFTAEVQKKAEEMMG